MKKEEIDFTYKDYLFEISHILNEEILNAAFLEGAFKEYSFRPDRYEGFLEKIKDIKTSEAADALYKKEVNIESQLFLAMDKYRELLMKLIRLYFEEITEEEFKEWKEEMNADIAER